MFFWQNSWRLNARADAKHTINFKRPYGYTTIGIKALTGLDRESAHPLITNPLHLGMQLYNSFASWHKAAMGGLIPYPIQ